MRLPRLHRAQFAHLLPQKSEVEEEMLELAVEVNDAGRLDCRLKLGESYEGLVVHTPSHSSSASSAEWHSFERAIARARILGFLRFAR